MSVCPYWCNWIYNTGWWFQTFFLFHNIWDNPNPIDYCNIFQDGCCTTNQMAMCGYHGDVQKKSSKTCESRFQKTWGCCLNWWSWMFMKLFILQSRHSFGGDLEEESPSSYKMFFVFVETWNKKDKDLLRLYSVPHIVDYWLKSYTLLPFSYTFCG